MEELKEEYKGIVKLNIIGKLAEEVYQEELEGIGLSLEQLREQKHEIKSSRESKEQYKKRVQS